jgi:NAD(P)-dependent dehydrogenase (short-subunit alcohol dehydrogenase family)
VAELRFDGQVAIVSGAGRGVGRAYARLLADRGARVCVNDIGASLAGDGYDETPANTVVELIRSSGGQASADFTDVTDPPSVSRFIESVVAEAGQIDIVISNHGTLRRMDFADLSFAAMQGEMDVHLSGSYHLAAAAWRHLVESGGRLLLTTSTGAYGDARGVAYGTAKSAIIGLTRGLAQVGEQCGVKVNAIAPAAFTRMFGSAHGLAESPEVADDEPRSPMLVAALAAVLAHPTCPTNGEIYVAGMRRFARILMAETAGYVHPSLRVEPEDVLAHWDDINQVAHHHFVPSLAVWRDKYYEAIEQVPIADESGGGITPTTA